MTTLPVRYDSITDVPGIKVGHWTNLDAIKGCTVILAEAGAVGGVDVRGGAPGTRETDLMRPGYMVQEVHAVLLTGGSAYGLDAAAGIMHWCEERGIGFPVRGGVVPIVAGAVLIDLGIGRWDIRPNAESGYAAADSASSGPVQEGSVGAGTGATVAKALGMANGFKGGIGTASEATVSGLIVGAIVAVNAVGEIFDSTTNSLVAAPRDADGHMIETIELIRQGRTGRPRPENTTIGVVATNARLNKEQANRLASVTHDGFARAIRPAHTTGDGDTIFALGTGERELTVGEVRAMEALSAVAMERAIVKAVRAATSLGGVPAVKSWSQHSTNDFGSTHTDSS